MRNTLAVVGFSAGRFGRLGSIGLIGLIGLYGLCGCFGPPASACTSMLVTKGASADGSVMVTYTCDGEFHPQLRQTPAADHAPGDSLPIEDWGGEVRGRIVQVPHTYGVIGMMNEHQLAIGESTFDGRVELANPDGLLGYWDLIELALQRCRTAREAITEMTRLAAEYGYCSTGESISIADPQEAWLLEIIGPGPGGSGALWVAVRIPDGMIACHANKARIGEFALNDPENCRYSPDVVDFAIARGYYDPASGEPFRFNEAYDPSVARNRRWADARVWSIFRRAAPSLALSPDYHRGAPDAEPYPLWIRPDRKLTLPDVVALMRDHFEGTAYDLTQGVDAGPYGAPYRWRPLEWEVDSVAYAWERAISTQQTGFSFVSQSRAGLPDGVGGVFWYGVDDTYTTCYVPLYGCIDAAPPAFATGELGRFSWDSAWWVFNFVASIANLRYCDMIKDIRVVQAELEEQAFVQQPAVERAALDLYSASPEGMRRYLTDYSLQQAAKVVERWRRLGEELLVKYNDGYVKDADGEPQSPGYPGDWLKRVARERGEALRIPPEVAPASRPRLVD